MVRNMKHSQTVYNDDFRAYCGKRAKTFCEHLKNDELDEEFPEMTVDGCRDEEIGDILRNLGASYKEIGNCLGTIETCADDKAASACVSELMNKYVNGDYDKLENQLFHEMLKSDSEQRDFFFSQLQGFSSAMEELGLPHGGDDNEFLLVDSQDAHIGSNNPIDALYADIRDPYMDNPKLEIFRNDSEPFFRAEFSDDLKGRSKELLFVPKEWAREAYENDPSIRHAVNMSLYGYNGCDEEIFNFLRDAKACADIEKNPLVHGIVRGFINYEEDTDTPGSTRFSQFLAKFDMDDFKSYCAENGFHADEAAEAAKTVEDAYNLSWKAGEYAFGYAEDSCTKNNIASKTAVSRGIHELFQRGDFDELQKTLGGYFQKDNAAKKSLESIGKSVSPSR